MTNQPSKAEVFTEFTPNPNSLKFNAGAMLIEKGSVFFESKETAQNASPLAERLFENENIENVMIGHDFVTVTRPASLDSWGVLIPFVTDVIQKHLQEKQPALYSHAQHLTEGKEAKTDVERKIQQVLNDYVRPAIARDGGDIVFHGFKEGVVTLYLQGACSSCPSSVATLKSGVERMLCQHVPEVKEVVQVS